MKPQRKLRHLQHEKKIKVLMIMLMQETKRYFSSRKNGKEKQHTPSLSGISANNQCSNLRWIMYFACSFEAVMLFFHVLLFFKNGRCPVT